MLEPQDSTVDAASPVFGPSHQRAFAAADELAVHHSGCVCPRCAGRLPGLLVELARAVDGIDAERGSR